MFRRLFAGGGQRDGGSPALEAVALGVPPLPEAAAGGEQIAVAPVKRHLTAAAEPTTRESINDVIIGKVLHGWLQNRHQTLFPLAVNLRTLDPEQRRILGEFAALALLAHADIVLDERVGIVRRWMLGAGGADDTIRALDNALLDPPATDRVIKAVLQQNLTAYAYIAALLALDAREAAAERYLDYLAARLSLPATLIRSANRRFRR